ncbi:ABC transporter, ATP-binding protein [Enterococcus faecalis 13-SD-W-01]|nr:ABC transporter, ATP-binding protein [Enterococcus faecalis 13-SD-W-01]
MDLLKKFIKENKGLVFLTIFFICIQILGVLGVPKLVAELIDQGIANNDQERIRRIGVEMLIVALIGAGAAVLSSYLSAVVSARFGIQTREKFFHKFQQFSISDIDRFGSNTLLTRMTNDVDNVQQMLVIFFQLILPAPIISLFALLITLQYSSVLTGLTAGFILVYSAVVYFLVKKGTPLSLTIQPKMDRITTKLREFFTGINMIRAFNNEDYEEKQANEAFKNYADGMIRVNRIFAWITPIAFLIMGLVSSIILWFGGMLVIEGNAQIGIITAVMEYSFLSIAYMMIGAMVFVMIPRALASLRRLQEVLVTEPEIKDPEDFIELTNKNAADTVVSFENIQFKYNEDAEPVLENITFDVPRGKTTAIVGGTGSGKSSLMKLLLKVNKPAEGKIRINDIDSQKLKQETIRSFISYVPQKAFLFSGTIRSNLLMGKEDATAEEISYASSIAQLDEFANSLPDRFDSFVAQGGANFSGGQKQRICIARALIKPAEIYVFDDSFSALDYKTDALLRARLQEEMSDKTLLIVAQRLSTIAHADNIIVLDKGRIVGQGTHDELLADNHYYQEFAASQGLLA